MIDVNYYARLAFGDDLNLISSLFGRYKFNNLFLFKKFLEELPNNETLLQKLNLNEETHKKLISQSNSLSLVIEGAIENPFDFLNKNVFPVVDVDNLLYDLNPKTSGGTVLVDCPCCQDTSTKAYIVKEGGDNTGTIACNRLKECGERTPIFTHVRDREGLDFISTVKFLANQVGIDYDVYSRNREMHVEDNGVFQDKTYICDSETINKKNIERKSKNPYGISEFETFTPNVDKSFRQVNLMKLLHNYNNYNDADKIRLIYSYIKHFTMKEPDRKDMHIYLGKRGITIDSAKDFGLLKANKINDLVSELKEVFGVNDLIKFKVLNEKGYWKYLLETKDKKFIYNDSIVSFMHDMYNDSPTNIEFKFFGDKTIGSKRKAISMSNSEELYSNYYSNITIDNIKSNENKDKFIWWNEGSLDVKCINSMGALSNGLIGAGKHFEKNLGFFKNKIHIICLDEDNAGIKSSLTLAKKLKMIGCSSIFTANWDEKYGNDINDLLNNKNLDKIKLTKIDFVLNQETNEYNLSYDITSQKTLNKSVIEKAYKELEKAHMEVSLATGQEIKNFIKDNTSIDISDILDIQKENNTPSINFTN